MSDVPRSATAMAPGSERLFRALYRLLRTVMLHQENNQVLAEAVDDFRSAVLADGGEGPITLQSYLGRFYFNGTKLRYSHTTPRVVHEMIEYFAKLGLPGIRLLPAARKAPAADIVAFARLLRAAETEDNALGWLGRQLETKHWSWVELVREHPAEATEDAPTLREASKRTYAGALTSLQAMAPKAASGQGLAMRSAIRIVQDMVDVILEDDSVMLALTTIRDHDDYTFVHSVNVAIHAIRFGKRLGLSRRSLIRLGSCALFHDLGKITVPHDIIVKPGKLEEREWRQMEQHPVNSARQILKMRISREFSSKIILPPLEHHRRFDLTGYPRMHRTEPISLFGRILAIVDVYDALTSARSYRPIPMSPDRALHCMWQDMGKQFDPILLKVFVNSLGLYPLGTLLLLDDDQLALVAGLPEKMDEWRPNVVLLEPKNEGGFTKGLTVNLADRDPKTGRYRRNIARSMHPSAMGIQPAEFLA